MKQIKRVVIAVAGGTVLALGIVLIVLPGPAFHVIPAGLVLLAVEFAWTYVAAFISLLIYFLWYLLPLLTGGRRRD